LGNLALLAVAKYYYGKKEYAKALSILKRISPPGAGSLTEEALVYYSLGQWEEMRDTLIQIHKPSPYARRLLAWNRFLLGDSREAIRNLQAVQKADPTSGKTLQMLEFVYLDLGGAENLAKALRLNAEAQALDPKDIFVASDRGAILYELGKFHEAADAFVALARKSPANSFALLLGYSALQRAGEAEQARRDLDEALRRLPDQRIDLEAGWHRTLARFLVGDASEKEVTQDMTSDDPYLRRTRECTGFFFLGRAAQDRGDRALARELFSRSLAAGVPSFYQHALARYELSQLGASRP